MACSQDKARYEQAQNERSLLPALKRSLVSSKLGPINLSLSELLLGLRSLLAGAD